MPYQEIDVDDFDCDLLYCKNNDKGCCDAECDVDFLKADSKKCSQYGFVKNREFITRVEYEVDEIVGACEDADIAYKIIDETSNRLVLKTVNDKSGLFRVSKEREEEYHFFSCVDGGVDFVHKSVKGADLFEEKAV